MADPRMSRNLDIALGGSSGPTAADVPAAPEPEVPEAGGGMKCPVCGSKFTVVPEEAPEAAEEAVSRETMAGGM
jgi:hypothetical protein